MRTDVKLGVAFALVMVLAAGGYFMFRGEKQKPISLADTAGADVKTQPTKPATTPAKNPTTNSNRPTIKPNPAGNPTGTATRPSGPATTNTPSPSKPTAPQPASRTTENTTAPATPNPRTVTPGGFTPTPASTDSSSTTLAGNPGTASNSVMERPTSPPVSPSVPGAAMAERPSTPTTGLPVGLTGIPAAPQLNPPGSRPNTGLTPLSNTPSNSMTSPASPNAVPSVTSTLPPGIKTVTAPKTDTANKGIGATDAAVDTHKVQVGDSLSSLAQTYYGDSKYAKVLADANPRLSDPSQLKVGTVVSIPPLPADAGSKISNGSALAGKPGEKSVDGKRTYTVKAGDSFYSIAKTQLGNASRWKELLALNNATVKGDPTALQPGQRIVLPESH